MKVRLIQFAYDWHTKLLEKSFLHHRDLCMLHGYDLHIETTPVTGRHLYWEKPRMILDSLMLGYDKVIWLDADALWVQGDIAVANLFSAFGMTFHGKSAPEGYTYPHLNAGVIYVNNGEEAIEITKEWIAEPDDNHPWHDQHALNKVISRRNSGVEVLGHEWNSVEWNEHYRSPDPMVVAWHGRPMQALKGIEEWTTEK